MQAVILVGGEGTRLRPLTYTLPKPMAPLLGRPFIGWIIERLREAGVDEIILSCCYMPEKIEAHFGDGHEHGVRLRYVFEETPLGTAGAIRNAIEHIEGMTYACNGDILTGLDLVKLREFHRRHDAVATIHTRPVDDPSHFGVVETDRDGRVLRFVEKPKPGETTAHDINAGTYILEPSAIEAIATGYPVSIERETFPHLIRSRGRVFALSTSDYWIDVGRPESYMRAHMDILDRKFEHPVGYQIGRDVWSADENVSFDGAHIEGPAYIGPGVRIERGATVGPYSALYDGCFVGEGAHVEGSILWPRCDVRRGSVVRGSILGLDISLSEGQQVEPGSVIALGNSEPSSRIVGGFLAQR